MTQIPLAEWRAIPAASRKWDSKESPNILPAHVGVWLDRMLVEKKNGGADEKGWPERLQLYRVAEAALALGDDNAAATPAVAAYREIFDRLRRELSAETVGVTRRLVEVETVSRLLLHPASGSTVTEGAILLHHTYGVPIIPGSAIKGAVRRRLRETTTGGLAADSQRVLVEELLGRVGTEGEPADGDGLDKPKALASLIDFLDALWIPERPARVLPGWSPLALDIVNPHHPSFYTTAAEGKRPWPRDSDEPSPVHRLTLTPGCRFLIVLEAASSPLVEPWLDWLIEQVLVPALAEDGLGSWSAAGYGRLRRVSSRPAPARSVAPPEPSPEWQRAHLFRIASSGELVAILPDGQRASARDRAARELFERLSQRLRDRLAKKKQREVLVEVRILPEGRSWKLVEIRQSGDEEARSDAQAE